MSHLTYRCCCVAIALLALVGWTESSHGTKAAGADDFLIVHCLLPGQLRQLGRRTTYVSARRPMRTTALDCRTRGGEYVRRDLAGLGSVLKLWLDKAQAGDAAAQTTLGELLEQGVDGRPDYVAAAGWYEQAATQGEPRAQVNLGHLYEQGLGVPKDAQRALQWYRRASGLGDNLALDPVQDIAPVVAAQERELRALRQQLQKLKTQQVGQREAERRQYEQQLAQLQDTIQTLEAQQPRAPVVVPTNLELAGPSIALIDPVLGQATRGLVKVSVAPEAATGDQRQLVGRVHAPAGLLSLTLNASPVAVNAAGVFQSLLTRTPGATEQPVVVTAIDKAGKRADLRFSLVFAAALPAPAQPIELPRSRAGNYHALLIGNNRYAQMPDLETPLNDVERLRHILQQQYGFEVQTLKDATRYDILAKLNELRASLDENDNLLLYYAGHGELDRKNQRGHWLPVDASPDSTANWLSNVDVTDILNVMQAKQVLLVVDSCYSGTLTRSSLGRLDPAMTAAERKTWLELMASKRSRVVLASGGLAPVMDAGGGEHSVFAKAFLDALENNVEILPGRALHEAVAARVAHMASAYEFEQIPEYAPISRAGHEAGDFLFLPD